MFAKINNVLAQRHKVGGGLLSPDGTHLCINIPKNASSFTSSWLAENGWRIVNYKHYQSLMSQVKYVVVILRDPLGRFVSGFAQYLKANIVCPVWHDDDPAHNQTFHAEDFEKHWPMIERIMADVCIWFDDHTMPQHFYHESVLPHVDRKYFYCNATFESTFKQHFNLPAPTSATEDNANITGLPTELDPTAIRPRLQKLIKASLENNVSLHRRVTTLLQEDYQKINSTQFIRYK